MKTGLLTLALVASLFGGLFGTGDEIVVTSLARDGRIWVSFAHAKGLTDDMREALRAGLPASITYEIELRRLVPVWFDQRVAEATVVNSAQYDTLTRLYQLSRAIDGRAEGTRSTADEDVVRQWMTSSGLERLALFPTTGLEPNTEYYIRVKAHGRPRLNWFVFWPFDRGAATGFAHFTFIPS